MLNSYIWSIDRTLSGATTTDQSSPSSASNEGVLCIPQSFSITDASPPDCLVSLSGHLLGKSYFSVEMLSVYSIAPANWATKQGFLTASLSQKSTEKKSTDYSVKKKGLGTALFKEGLPDCSGTLKKKIAIDFLQKVDNCF